MNFQEFLAKHKACEEARAWTGDKTAEQAWEQCTRADWMLWLIKRLVQKQELQQEIVRAAVDIARTVLVHTTDRRVHDCIDATDRWLAGEQVNLPDAIVAIEDYAEANSKADRAARAAAWAAESATWIDPVDVDVDDTAAQAAGDGVLAATWAAQCDPAGNQHAGIIRKHLPWTMIQPLLERAMQETV